MREELKRIAESMSDGLLDSLWKEFGTQSSLYKEALDAVGGGRAPANGPVMLPNGWTIEVNGDHVRVRKPNGGASEWYGRPATNGSGMYDLCRDLYFQHRGEND